MKFTETFEFETRFGRQRHTIEARVTYTIDHAMPQAYGQPAEAAQVGPDMDFEVKLSGKWHKTDDLLHDLLLEVMGDDLDWLIESADEQALERMEAAE